MKKNAIQYIVVMIGEIISKNMIQSDIYVLKIVWAMLMKVKIIIVMIHAPKELIVSLQVLNQIQ